MTQHQHSITPLRQRMIEDMDIRKLSPKTQSCYIRAVKKLTHFLDHSPDTATAEDLRRFQLHLVNSGVSSITVNATITGLKFFFEITLDRWDVLRKMSTVPVPRKLPVMLSREEVARLLEAADNLKYKAALSIAYGAGLRISEVVSLKAGDIDSTRMTLRVEQGKGRKDRYAMLSPVLLELLRTWWREGHAQGKLLDGGWLFPGQNPVNPMSSRQLSRACQAIAISAELDKRVTMHSLRHSYATHLLEQKVDIRVIQVLLGHSKIQTTCRYTQVATNLLHEVVCPLDTLSPPSSSESLIS
ncbi:MAG: site-specific integrase [Candidatus Polarisedimenticolaceae bacterium]|nr:site-specific integrase [Candidatus Polarisedimenticolaceae bacterium]